MNARHYKFLTCLTLEALFQQGFIFLPSLQTRHRSKECYRCINRNDKADEKAAAESEHDRWEKHLPEHVITHTTTPSTRPL
jgi:hypothetical protein